jgi:hypothetical protein
VKLADRRALLTILEDREPNSVQEPAGEPERSLATLVTGLANKTLAYRRDIGAMLDVADTLMGKVPGFDEPLEQLISALEMSDKMLEDLVDAALGDAKPVFKKLGLNPPRT